ncbi:probable RNA-binding protein 18 [Actinia tenebrosa]|uniref:Probable RNA-binding protein 18 n=1 Tax=Actinia tenebrosa TaxID=6105 RepID=A0A6P8IAM5_ACTTE|nr:probable RNA-binding protein 18 [Actinia tenebrosa]
MADEEGGSKLPSNDEEEKEVSHRLWMGNIDKRLSEYNLLKIVQRFGQVKQFEYLFHTSGPHKGEPRGYCFVQYESKQEATKAMKALNGKMALSRALVVRWANDDQKTSQLQGKIEVKQIEEKAGSSLSSISHDTKIQAIEAKLKLMESANYSDNTTTHGSKHPLLLESERNKNKPYQCSKTKSKTEKWKIVNKPR